MPEDIVVNTPAEQPATPAPVEVTPVLDTIESLPASVQKLIRDLRKENADTRAAMKEAEQKRLRESGQFEALANTLKAENEALKAYEARAQALEADIAEGNKKRIANIPENMRTLVPSNYAPSELSKWLDVNSNALQPKQAPNLNAGAAGETVSISDLSPAEIELARKFGQKPEDYAKSKAAIAASQAARMKLPV